MVTGQLYSRHQYIYNYNDLSPPSSHYIYIGAFLYEITWEEMPLCFSAVSCGVVWKFCISLSHLNYKMLTRLHLSAMHHYYGPTTPPPPCIIGKIRDVVQMNLNLKLGGPFNLHPRHWIITLNSDSSCLIFQLKHCNADKLILLNWR